MNIATISSRDDYARFLGALQLIGHARWGMSPDADDLRNAKDHADRIIQEVVRYFETLAFEAEMSSGQAIERPELDRVVEAVAPFTDSLEAAADNLTEMEEASEPFYDRPLVGEFV